MAKVKANTRLKQAPRRTIGKYRVARTPSRPWSAEPSRIMDAAASASARSGSSLAPRPRFAAGKTANLVQVRNPRSGKYLVVDRAEGKILTYKSSDGPYRNVPISRVRKTA